MKLPAYIHKTKRAREETPEMGFVDHLEALRGHLIRIVIALILCSIVAFVYNSELFDKIILAPTHKDFISYTLLCKLGSWIHIPSLCLEEVKMNFQNTEMSGQFMMSFSSSFVIGFIIAFPYIIWELWRFIKPALSQRELKNASGIIFWVTLLFLSGVLFGYYIITPYTVNFFANYKISEQFQNIIKIDDYLSTIMSLTVGTGLVFELPVLVYFLSKVGLLTPVLMTTYRKFAIVAILVIAAVITPPDVFSQIIVTIPLWLLYELSIFISARVQKENNKKELAFFAD